LSIDQSEMVIALAKRQGNFSRNDVQTVLGIGQTTAGRLLRQMLDEGKIIRRGTGRNAHYLLNE